MILTNNKSSSSWITLSSLYSKIIKIIYTSNNKMISFSIIRIVMIIAYYYSLNNRNRDNNYRKETTIYGKVSLILYSILRRVCLPLIWII